MILELYLFGCVVSWIISTFGFQSYYNSGKEFSKLDYFTYTLMVFSSWIIVVLLVIRLVRPFFEEPE